MASISFFTNDVYYSYHAKSGVECNKGLDRYFFAYLGLMAASVTLLFNAISTYTGVVRNSWMVSENRSKTSKTFVAIWMIALLLATLLVVEHMYFPTFRFLKPSLLSTLLIMLGSAFHIRVVRFLKASGK